MTEEIKPTGYNSIRCSTDEKTYLIYCVPIHLYNNIRYSADKKLI